MTLRMRTVATLVLWLSAGLGQDGAAQSGSADRDAWKTDFTRHTVPLDEIVPGGPPRDGIPALDDPRFIDMREAEAWLADAEPVIVVVAGGVARAYPYQVLLWHEIVNDVVGGVPVTITYCPLCNTALAFHREHGGRVLDFGTTGRLRHSDMVMYDRQTESWWQQATGEAIVGAQAGERLRLHPAQTLSWAGFKRAHPDGRVLSRDTGYDRPYGRNPYRGYDQRRGPLASFFRREVDGRLPAMERVAALPDLEPPVAYPFSSLRSNRVVNDVVGGHPVVVLWTPGTVSAVDADAVADGRDVGSTGVFRREASGRVLTFRPTGADTFEDEETGSTWDVTGRAVAGPLEGTRLAAVNHGDYFWFAWAAFKPGTEIRGR